MQHFSTADQSLATEHTSAPRRDVDGVSGSGTEADLLTMSAIPDTPERAWRMCLETIRENVTFRAFKTWFEPTRALRLDGATLTIQVPSPFFYEWIEEHFHSLVRKTILQVLGERGELIYQAVTDQAQEPPQSRVVTLPARSTVTAAPPRRVGTPQPSIPSPFVPIATEPVEHAPAQLNSRFTFENFITGDCNQLAYAAAKAVADNPGGTRFNPLVIYGGVGLGKTHLIQAVGHAILEKDPGRPVMYISSERFTLEFVNAIQHNKSQEFINYYRSVDVLIVDDIQFFADKEKTQDNFFHTFNALHQAGKQIILTSDVPPKQLRGVDERLISRFQWGLTADMQAPDLETRIAILQKMSHDEGYHLPGDVIDYIARNVTSSVRELEGCLISLLAECSLRNLSMSLDLAREVVSGIATPTETVINIEQIQQTVCKQLDVPITLLTGKTRKQEIVFARQIAMYLIRELTPTSLKNIGNHFGGRDHTTVMHAISTIDTLKSRDEHTRRTLATIRRTLGVAER
jgi:chromosomal replication initiator protein